jgi:hypothetical protein
VDSLRDISKAIDKIAPRNELFEKIGEFLRQKRIERGLTVIEVAKYFPSETGGITGCVSNWELGKNVPTKEQWQKLIEILSITEEEQNEFTPLIERIEAEREVIGKGECGNPVAWYSGGKSEKLIYDITAPATPEAKKWQGWGTALKPACEPIVLARKPISEKNITQNVLKWGTGGLNIDGCRIGNEIIPAQKRGNAVSVSFQSGGFTPEHQGRFPANVILDEEAGKMLDEQSGTTARGLRAKVYSNYENKFDNAIFNFGDGAKERIRVRRLRWCFPFFLLC